MAGHCMVNSKGETICTSGADITNVPLKESINLAEKVSI